MLDATSHRSSSRHRLQPVSRQSRQTPLSLQTEFHVTEPSADSLHDIVSYHAPTPIDDAACFDFPRRHLFPPLFRDFSLSTSFIAARHFDIVRYRSMPFGRASRRRFDVARDLYVITPFHYP